jgi:large subunit ribosomal protein L4
MMRLPVHNTSGEVIDHVEVDDGVFAVPLNEAVVHQAMVRQLANARVGTADTKTRGEVVGSTRKLYRQKHTGRARRGNIRSPLLRGGGVTFGPHPRDYRQRMPRRMRRLALKCVLSAKAASGELVVVDQLKLEQAKTQSLAEMLKAIGVSAPALIATSGPDTVVVKSARNLPAVRTLPANLLSVLDVLTSS